MFGYIKTHRPELKVWEDEVYKGVYCSLCRELGKRYGLIARLFLSYDATFLAIAILALGSDKIDFISKRCPFNLAKKCNFCKNREEAVTYAADISVFLIYYKLKDNIHDKSFFKSILYRLLLLFVLRPYKKARNFLPYMDGVFKKYMDLQFLRERENEKSLDLAAEPSALMLSEVYSFGEKNDTEKKVRQRIGYLVGRWVYIIDAFDDVQKDKKNSGYNPLLEDENYSPETVKGDLIYTAGEIVKAYSLLDVKKFDGILKNVIYDGLYYETLKVYERRRKDEQPL